MKAFALCLLALLVFPALASADVETITFESPAPLNAPLDESAGHRIRFPSQEGFRPYPTAVGEALAKSGTAVGHIGRCVEEVEATGEGEPEGCIGASAGTTAVLTQTARSVTVFAGVFESEPPTFAVLKTFDAEGHLLESTGPVGLSEAKFGFHQRLEVTDAAGRIARFTIESTEGPGEERQPPLDLAIDDLSVDFVAGGAPDFALTAINQVVPLVQGQHVDLPVRVTRLNGSHGTIEVSASGLPEGVSANVVRLEGDETKATITLTADSSAPDTNFVPAAGAVTAQPIGIAVGAATRSTPLFVRVATDFRLSAGGGAEPEGGPVFVQAPDCGPADIPIRIARDIAMNRDVSLSIEEEGEEGAGPLDGVSAEFLPAATVAPGGNLLAERTLRLRAGPESALAVHPLHLIVTGSDGPGGNSRSLELVVTRFNRASIATTTPGSGLGDTPRFGRDGTAVQLHGLGFCPGTRVEVGNDRANAPTRLRNDTTLEFNVPRYATSGPVKIIPPGRLRKYQSEASLVVDSVRNSNGFAFKNYLVDSLGIGEFTKAFGTESLFVNVNPCWPFGDCSINTGILNPLAAIDWGWMNIGLQGSGGHCVGISIAAEQLQEGKLKYRQIADPGKGNARSAFEASNRGGANGILNELLDAYQAREYSDEFLSARFSRSPSLGPQLARLEREFSKNRLPIVVLQKSFGEEHAAIAYDMTQTATKAEISLYDSEEPFSESEELAELDSSTHHASVDNSTVTIDKTTGTWSYPIGGWTGSATDGGFWVVPASATPEHPSLPGFGALTSAVGSLGSIALGSSDGSARAVPPSGGRTTLPPRASRANPAAASAHSAPAEFLPTSDRGAVPGSTGVWVSADDSCPLEGAVEGLKTGHYTESYAVPGFVASAGDVSTAKGVRDELSGLHDTFGFDSGTARPLELDLARRVSATETDAATVHTHASGNGHDSVGLARGGALSYAHRGADTNVSFSLTSVRRDGGGSTFLSGPVRVRGGERLRAAPLDREMRRVRLEIHHADGSTTVRVLRNRARAPGRIRLRAARASGGKLVLPFRLAGFHEAGVVGVALRLQRDGRVVARRSLALKAGNGLRRAAWKLPRRLRHGSYRLLADLRVLTAGARGSTVSQSVSAKAARRVDLR